MAGHFSLFKLSCTTYLRLRSITTADQMRLSLFIFGLQSLHRVIYVRIAFDHHHFTASPSTAMTMSSFTASHIQRPCHFIASAATTSLHHIGCDHVTSSHRLRPHHFIVSAAGTSFHRIGCDHVTSSYRLRARHFITSAMTASLHRIGCDHVTSSYRLRARHFITSAMTTSLHLIGCDHVHFIVSAAGTSSLRRLRLPSHHRLSITPSTAAVSTSSISTLHRQRLPFLLGTITSAYAMTSCDTFFALSLGIRHLITPICQSSLSPTVRTGRAGFQLLASWATCLFTTG